MYTTAGWRCAACRRRERLGALFAVPKHAIATKARTGSSNDSERKSTSQSLWKRLSADLKKIQPSEAQWGDLHGFRREWDNFRNKGREMRLRRARENLDLPVAVIQELSKMRSLAKDATFKKEIGIVDQHDLERFDEFISKLTKAAHLWKKSEGDPSPSYLSLHSAFAQSRQVGRETLRYWLQHHIAQGQISNTASTAAANAAALAKFKELEHPIEWYRSARQMKRKIHLHIGPTNSGKTFHALERLKTAETGVYAGPLRLLAHEIFNSMNSQGKPCDLLTGDLRINAPTTEANTPAPLVSCTVEMLPCDRPVDVAVIDEIQLMADADRGHSWTTALLATRANELHLCGEESTLPLIKLISASMGDELHVHTYKRLNPLNVMHESFKENLGKLEKGDCVVAFSKKAIHFLRGEIERRTKKKVAVIYGTLPPETRTQQASLFNDPTNDYDFLVASDAIGMGLNLSIKRLIFSDFSKNDGHRVGPITVSQMKQVAGRAGRFRVAPTVSTPFTPSAGESRQETLEENVAKPKVEGTSRADVVHSPGLVTTLSEKDMSSLQNGMQAAVPPLKFGYIWVPRDKIVQFASRYPSTTPLSYIIRRIAELCQLHTPFKVHPPRVMCRKAHLIQKFENLSITDRLSFCDAPVRSAKEAEALYCALAKRVDEWRPASILDIEEFELGLLDRQDGFDHDYLTKLEALHDDLTIYIWLSYRFDALFVSRPLALHARELVEKHIEKVLAELEGKTLASQTLTIRGGRPSQRKNAAQIPLEELASKRAGLSGKSIFRPLAHGSFYQAPGTSAVLSAAA